MAEEKLNADAVMHEPQHKKYLESAQLVDNAHDIPSAAANEIYDATRDVARMVLRMDDEESRIKFARNQLEASLRKQLAGIRRIDVEIVPLRAMVGDNLDESTRGLWNELNQQLARIAEKVRAVSEVDA